MPIYRVSSETTELPRGYRFTTIPKFPLELGALILFSLNGRLQIGRWCPNWLDHDCILQLGERPRIIKITSNIVRIIGTVTSLQIMQMLFDVLEDCLDFI